MLAIHRDDDRIPNLGNKDLQGLSIREWVYDKAHLRLVPNF